MAKTSGLYGKEKADPRWVKLINSLSASSLGLTAVSVITTIVGGPGLLIAAIAAIPVGKAAAKQVKVIRKRRKGMYSLPDQKQNLNGLRRQLTNSSDVLIARFSKRGKIKEVFIGDKREPYKGVPASEIMSFDELLSAADKDDNREPVVLFFGRPL